jgi:hypothetical protein
VSVDQIEDEKDAVVPASHEVGEAHACARHQLAVAGGKRFGEALLEQRAPQHDVHGRCPPFAMNAVTAGAGMRRLERDLLSDPELRDAREFMQRLLARSRCETS